MVVILSIKFWADLLCINSWLIQHWALVKNGVGDQD